MLLNFSVSNFTSFNQQTTFSMCSGKISKQHPEHVLKGTIFNALKGSAIYGANASGKSNVIKALRALYMYVLHNETSIIFNNEFKLSNEHVYTEFDIDFEEQGLVYNYCLQTNGAKVFKEELSLIQKYGKSKLIFSRNELEVTLGQDLKHSSFWYKSRTFKQQTTFIFKLIDDGINEKADEISGSNHIKNIEMFFSKLCFVTPKTSLPNSFIKFFQEIQGFQEYVKQLLKIADLGITDIKWASLPRESTEHYYKLIQKEQTLLPLLPTQPILCVIDENVIYIEVQEGNKQGYVLKTIHNDVEFEINQESSGTKRLLELALAFFLLKNLQICLIIDELDCHLHLFLSKFMIQSHMNKETSKGQLIITLHDANLMSNEIWRSDEIWFTEKRIDGSTDLYSLYQFKPRFDKNLQTGYMQGKYGAIPMIGDFDE